MAAQTINTQRRPVQASRDAGSYRGTIREWYGPQTHSQAEDTRERVVMQRRAADLAANDWAAHSAVEAITSNAVGTGLVPKANIPAKMLGIAPELAQKIGEQMEWCFAFWGNEADVRGRSHFVDLQMLGLRTMLSMGEMLHVVIRLPEHEVKTQGRTFSLALQTLSPQRLMTPADLRLDPAIRDGVRLTDYGRPEGYYLATPAATVADTPLTADGNTLFSSQDFTYIPAMLGHWPRLFHLFRQETDEQVRGVSTFSKGISLFRNLSDTLSYELFAQLISASFPMFISMEDGGVQLSDAVQNVHGGEDGEEREDIQHIKPGQVYYGRANEKPIPLESKRPSANFAAFVEIILRATSASVGIPYESLTKDFSKTNYSSARAAMNEAWRLYQYYRNWFGRLYCQKIWEMVLEEAFLRGMFTLPASAPGFFEARALWCNADWVGPARGFVDPVKEITATILGLQNHLLTYDEAWAERGGDFGEGLAKMREESRQIASLAPLDLSTRIAGQPATSDTPDDEDGKNGETDDADEADK